jgi:hypothetical protein
MRRVSQLLIASVSLYAAHPICSHAVQRQIAATVQAVATSSLFTPVMLQARLPPSLPEPSVTCAFSSCNCVTCRPSRFSIDICIYIYIYICIYMYIWLCICVCAYVNIYLYYLYAICCTFICYALQSCYNKGMDARQWVTVSILAMCIQVRLLVESKASTDHYSYTCTQTVRNTASPCFGISGIVVSQNMPTKTSSGSMWIHRYFRSCSHFHEVVVSCVCLS